MKTAMIAGVCVLLMAIGCSESADEDKDTGVTAKKDTGVTAKKDTGVTAKKDTGQVQTNYGDPCNSAMDCDSGECVAFGGKNLCTQPCGAAGACPKGHPCVTSAGKKLCDPSGGATVDQGVKPDTKPACPGAKDCTGRVCGLDPVCGLSCGTCQNGQTCNNGKCTGSTCVAAGGDCTGGKTCCMDSTGLPLICYSSTIMTTKTCCTGKGMKCDGAGSGVCCDYLPCVKYGTGDFKCQK
jgi:hypothetical protein